MQTCSLPQWRLRWRPTRAPSKQASKHDSRSRQCLQPSPSGRKISRRVTFPIMTVHAKSLFKRKLSFPFSPSWEIPSLETLGSGSRVTSVTTHKMMSLLSVDCPKTPTPLHPLGVELRYGVNQAHQNTLYFLGSHFILWSCSGQQTFHNTWQCGLLGRRRNSPFL